MIQFGNYDLNAANEERAVLERAGGGEFFKLAVGKNILRFLPPPAGGRSPFVQIYQHFVKLPGMEKAVSFNCPRMSPGHKPCPMCLKIDDLRGTGNDLDYRMAGDFLAKIRILANIISRKNEDMGPKVFGFGSSIHDPLVALRQDEDAGGDFSHPINGFDITIERKGSTMNDTEYTVRPSRVTSPLAATDEIMQEWIDSQPDLQRFARILPFEEIRALLISGGAQLGPSRPRPQMAARQPAPRLASPAVQTVVAKPRTAEDDAYAEPDAGDGDNIPF